MIEILTGLAQGALGVGLGCALIAWHSRRQRPSADPDTTPGPIDGTWLRLELQYRMPDAHREPR